MLRQVHRAPLGGRTARSLRTAARWPGAAVGASGTAARRVRWGGVPPQRRRGYSRRYVSLKLVPLEPSALVRASYAPFDGSSAVGP